MKKLSVFLFLLFVSISIYSQDTTTVQAESSDISDNLDLEAVAAVFGDSKDLEDFEKKLNDPKTKISNLDLNKDGEVDYLRVVENSKKNTHVVSIQAVIGKDQYQDIATIDVEKDSKGETQVQVVGDVYMYGADYIVQPVYVSPPVIYGWFWGPYYGPWHSPYYWGYYPPIFRPWAVVAVHHYRHHAHVHAHHHHSYHHTTVRISNNAVRIQNNVSRNDLARTQPNNSFQDRNKGVTNKQGLNRSTPSTTSTTRNQNNRTGKTTTGRKTQPNWKSQSKGRVHQSTRPSTSNRQQSTRPSTNFNRPSTNYNRPSTRSYSPPSRSMRGRRR